MTHHAPPGRNDLDLDDLARLASEASGPKLDDEARRALTRQAVLAGQARHQKQRDRRWLAGAASVLAVAASLALALRLTAPPSSSGASSSGASSSGASSSGVSSSGAIAEQSPVDYELALATGDHLFARHHVRFEVESQTPSARRVRLEEGAMVFDVATLGPGATFEVVTDDATVRVLGTVFVVETGDRGTSVEVFEGRVEVLDGAARLTLVAGERHDEAAATHRTAALAAHARSAASGRVARVSPRDPVATVAEAAERTSADRRVSEPNEGGLVVRDGRPSGRPAVAARSLEEASPEDAALEETRPEEARPELAPATGADQVALAGGPPPPTVPEGAGSEVGDTVAAARAALREGDAEQALALARSLGGDPSSAVRGEAAALALVEGDALRVLGRPREAVRAYARILRSEEASSERALAGFLSAELSFRRLRDGHAAARTLDQSGALDVGSLRERALALRAEVAVDSGDAPALAAAREAYLSEYPSGPRSAWMRAQSIERPSR